MEDTWVLLRKIEIIDDGSKGARQWLLIMQFWNLIGFHLMGYGWLVWVWRPSSKIRTQCPQIALDDPVTACHLIPSILSPRAQLRVAEWLLSKSMGDGVSAARATSGISVSEPDLPAPHAEMSQSEETVRSPGKSHRYRLNFQAD